MQRVQLKQISPDPALLQDSMSPMLISVLDTVIIFPEELTKQFLKKRKLSVYTVLSCTGNKDSWTNEKKQEILMAF